MESKKLAIGLPVYFLPVFISKLRQKVYEILYAAIFASNPYRKPLADRLPIFVKRYIVKQVVFFLMKEWLALVMENKRRGWHRDILDMDITRVNSIRTSVGVAPEDYLCYQGFTGKQLNVLNGEIRKSFFRVARSVHLPDDQLLVLAKVFLLTDLQKTLNEWHNNVAPLGNVPWHDFLCLRGFDEDEQEFLRPLISIVLNKLNGLW